MRRGSSLIPNPKQNRLPCPTKQSNCQSPSSEGILAQRPRQHQAELRRLCLRLSSLTDRRRQRWALRLLLRPEIRKILHLAPVFWLYDSFENASGVRTWIGREPKVSRSLVSKTPSKVSSEAAIQDGILFFLALRPPKPPRIMQRSHA